MESVSKTYTLTYGGFKVKNKKAVVYQYGNWNILDNIKLFELIKKDYKIEGEKYFDTIQEAKEYMTKININMI